VGQQVGKERVLGSRVQALQRLGVGGVARLDLLGARQIKLVEKHCLQLLWRAEINLLPHRLPGSLLGCADPDVELGVETIQHIGVQRNTRAFHPGQDELQRHLDLVEQTALTQRVQFTDQRRRQIDDCPGPHHGSLGLLVG